MFNVLLMFRKKVGRVSKDKMYRENGRAVQTIAMARVSWQQGQHRNREALKGFLLLSQKDVDQEVQTFNGQTIVEAQINQVVIREEDNSLPFFMLYRPNTLTHWPHPIHNHLFPKLFFSSPARERIVEIIQKRRVWLGRGPNRTSGKKLHLLYQTIPNLGFRLLPK